MSIIGIIENQKQAERLKRYIETENSDIKLEIVAINSNSIENIKNIKFDVIIISNSLEKIGEKKDIVKDILESSKYLILNEDINIDSDILKDIKAQIITYGLNQKSTITLSSICDKEIIICIQRAFKNTQNKVVEPKEIKGAIDRNNINNIYKFLIKEAIINIYGA